MLTSTAPPSRIATVRNPNWRSRRQSNQVTTLTAYCCAPDGGVGVTVVVPSTTPTPTMWLASAVDAGVVVSTTEPAPGRDAGSVWLAIR